MFAIVRGSAKCFCATLLLVAPLALSACSRDASGTDRRTAEAAPPRSGEQKVLTIADRLQRERDSRTAGATPRAEDVVAALRRAGIAAGPFRQHWAAPMGASYCIGGQSAAKLPLSVCEYPSESAARLAEARVPKTAGLLHGTWFVNKTASLTIVEPERTPLTAAEAAKAAELFAGL